MAEGVSSVIRKAAVIPPFLKNSAKNLTGLKKEEYEVFAPYANGTDGKLRSMINNEQPCQFIDSFCISKDILLPCSEI